VRIPRPGWIPYSTLLLGAARHRPRGGRGPWRTALLAELVAYEPGKGFVLHRNLDNVPAAEPVAAVRAGAQLEGSELVRLLR
jgi:hypothetical protein